MNGKNIHYTYTALRNNVIETGLLREEFINDRQDRVEIAQNRSRYLYFKFGKFYLVRNTIAYIFTKDGVLLETFGKTTIATTTETNDALTIAFNVIWNYTANL